MNIPQLEETLKNRQTTIEYYENKMKYFKNLLEINKEPKPNLCVYARKWDYNMRKRNGAVASKAAIKQNLDARKNQCLKLIRKQKEIRDEIISIRNDRYQSIVSDRYNEIRGTT
jgi:hypothetical protein